MAEDWEAGGFAIYFHWPFCAAKCPYCDFNSHVSRSIDQDRWCDAYLAEIDRIAHKVGGRTLTSVFFGGGTPSLMDPETVHAVLDRIGKHWPVANAMEVTLEANPGSVEAGRFAGYRQAGVTRLSMGVQALNDRDLQKLGRIHSRAEAIAAYEIARTHFDRVSFDLIYARQDQSLDAWKHELSEALSLAVDHLSLYQLTIEPGTAFGDRFARGGLRGLPGEDLSADMYELTQDLCEAAGFPAYEVSNHARDGAACRHNKVYWRYGDYAGIGPGAHGRLTTGDARYATECLPAPGAWLEAVARGSGESNRAEIVPAEQGDEYLLFGLRLVEGIDVRRYQALSGHALPEAPRAELAEMGLVFDDGQNLRTTRSGRLVLNSIIERLSRD